MKRLLKITAIVILSLVLQTCKKSTLPVLTTENVSEITRTSAKSGGNVSNNGGAEVTARGVCWGTTKNPSVSSTKTSDGTGNGEFESDITGLSPQTTYYLRSYAINTEGPGYGNEISFVTGSIVPPVLTTNVISSITSTTAVSGGNIVDDGGGSITDRGVCWNTSSNPTTSDNKTTDGTGTGSFTSNLTNLLPGTTYYVKAYATNSSGTGYATNELTFTTSCQTPSAPVVGTITQPTCVVATGSVALNGLPANGSWTLTRIPGGMTTMGTGTSTTISGLAAGNYTFTVTNASGCVSAVSGNVVINAPLVSPSAPVVGIITQPTCAVPTGSVVLSGLPATGSWTLTRTPGATTNTGTGASTTISGLATGSYTFTATNASGCVSAASGSIVISIQPTAPSATTNPPTGVTSTAATLNGTVNANGASTTVIFLYGKTTSYGSTVTATQSPVAGSSSTSVNTGITGLSPNTEYHFQVKAENCKGINSGTDQQFTTTSGCSDAFETNNTIATANTTAFSTLGTANYTNTIYGTIDNTSDIDYYRLNITTAGIITITSYSPGADRDITLYNANGVAIDNSVRGYRESIIYPVTATGYYYITVWGGVPSCMTYDLSIKWEPGANTGTFTDYRDGHEYKWVYIGTQFWMAENLNVGNMINGSQEQTSNGVIEKYCYNDNESNCTLYGGLYQWEEMMQYSEGEKSHGVCPDDWHVPSDSEWKTLEMALGMRQSDADGTAWRGNDEGGKLKAVSSLWTGENVGATNSSHFSALPTGDRTLTGTYESLGSFADFWTSTMNTLNGAIWWRKLDSDHATVYRDQGNRKYGTALRCIKD